MKITNKQIKIIIKEEINSVLKKLRYPGGHPDSKILKKTRREDAGIDPIFLKKIEDLEKKDPMAARELAVALGSQETLETMPDDPKNVIKLKNDIVSLRTKIRASIMKDSGLWRTETPKLIKMLDQLSAMTGETQDEIDTAAFAQTNFHRNYSGDHGPLKVFSPGKMGTRLSESSENFSPTFEKLKSMMVADYEAYNQANELLNQIKGSGMMEPSEEELLEKVANYARAYYDEKRLKRERRSLMDFDGNFYQLPSKVDAMKKYREISKQLKELRKQLKETEKELGYDAFASSIKRNIRGEYGVLQSIGL
tara:strand:+ start:186 stop:1112 length:927 start_codon:yes stop_codon:yes gene_type:complete